MGDVEIGGNNGESVSNEWMTKDSTRKQSKAKQHKPQGRRNVRNHNDVRPTMLSVGKGAVSRTLVSKGNDTLLLLLLLLRLVTKLGQ